MKKYLVISPPFNEIVGGTIVLHYLVHLLRDSGREAYLCPYFENIEFNIYNKRKILRALYKGLLRRVREYKTCPNFNTPIIYDPRFIKNQQDEWVVVYPDIVLGNPVQAKNVVRWFLHNPGFHTKNKLFFGVNELHFKFNNSIKDFFISGSTLSSFVFKIIRFPVKIYTQNEVASSRKGTAYCLRKGASKKIVHDLKDSILIDNKSHQEVAEIFKRVQTFISYDTMSAYSMFAALSGCDSVVIPDDGVSEADWCPDVRDSYGISYGFDNIERARLTRHLVIENVKRIQAENRQNVDIFLSECEFFFTNRVL